ncbi:dephospho-CoA kinase [Desemzia sp. RIT804]|uniref:dephospho-CoA kinase n=1 Tax=Desemzia sp. RIT 804 TaxID=2810209 RepID=UPI00195006B5|nr:dephospho-CoA kinase [Desemzia sp. RIT 804]MBM6613436.1 dephospho-CoA kinase [Desemzia sp. RIT 804]
MSFILGLTGSIATGKSTVSNIFKQAGVPVVDADVGAREVVKPGTEGLKRIEAAFGRDVISASGSLDRKALGKIVFQNKSELKKLNHILGDLIAIWIQSEKEKYIHQGAPLIVLDIPLLFESGYDQDVEKVMVVATTPSIQLERLMRRDQIDTQSAQQKIDAQQSITEKIMKADFVIDNNGSKENTQKQVLYWLEKQDVYK